MSGLSTKCPVRPNEARAACISRASNLREPRPSVGPLLPPPSPGSRTLLESGMLLPGTCCDVRCCERRGCKSSCDDARPLCTHAGAVVAIGESLMNCGWSLPTASPSAGSGRPWSLDIADTWQYSQQRGLLQSLSDERLTRPMAYAVRDCNNMQPLPAHLLRKAQTLATS